MAKALVSAVLVILLSGLAGAQDIPTKAKVAGFTVIPTQVVQCQPIRIYLKVTNQSDEPIYSQRPYAGATYNLYHTLTDKGIETLPDRLAVGISLNGGADGYPYRWGFRGHLAPGRSVSIMGFLSLIEVGDYTLTASMLLGDQPIGSTSEIAVKVLTYAPKPNTQQPVSARPIYPMINGRRLPLTMPYTDGGFLMVPVRPFVQSMGASLSFVEHTVVINTPGLELVLFPGKQEVLLNGVSVAMPAPACVFNGVSYAPVRYMSPLLGQTFYWYSGSRLLCMYSPGPYQSVCEAP